MGNLACATLPRGASALGKDADGALGEARRLDAEDAVEARAMVPPRDRRGELDELGLVEALAEPRAQLLGYVGGRPRHRHGQVQHQAFAGVEGRARLVAREL